MNVNTKGIPTATMPNGTHITRYESLGGWGPTIQINTGVGLPYKIRIQ
jgi:hypothetical protein